MGILTRFKDIIDSNINSLLDKAENSEKMIDQYLRKMALDLDQVEKETAAVMAEEKRNERLVEENEKKARKYTELAKRALIAKNDNDAGVFISKKQEIENAGAELKLTYAVAHENSLKMRQMHDKLKKDMNRLKVKKQEIQTKIYQENAINKVNKYAKSNNGIDSTQGNFERIEERVDRRLDVAKARAELNTSPIDEAQELETKYNLSSFNSSVIDEVAALKAQMGLDEAQILEQKYNQEDSVSDELEAMKSQLASDKSF